MSSLCTSVTSLYLLVFNMANTLPACIKTAQAFYQNDVRADTSTPILVHALYRPLYDGMC